MSIRIQDAQTYQRLYKESVENPQDFWAKEASSFYWQQPWSQVLDWDFNKVSVRWFEGGVLNITENCLDRHLAERGGDTALIWEPNEVDGIAQRYTYSELHQAVCQMANCLKSQGVEKGDRVCLYMPMIPELCIAVLACARIGAVHSVVFAGFSAKALRNRIEDAGAKLLLTASCSYRGNKQLNLKSIVDQALIGSSPVENVLVYKNSTIDTSMQEGRDIDWQTTVSTFDTVCPATPMQAEDPLFILYTSGSTGQPKGVVHSTAGYMVYTAFSFRNVFQYERGDVYWCTADIGWITGHSYIVYGPLLEGATTLMFEGVPTYPDAGRFWQVCEKYEVNQFYTAPTAIRALQAQGNQWVEQYNLSSLKVLGTVGEPINEEAWHWYHKIVGKEKCSIVDTWWQTETGGMMIAPMAGWGPQKPCYAALPLPGIQLKLVDAKGEEIKENEREGLLCISFPWPSMIRTVYGDHERCKQVYFSAFEQMYFTGDAARRDENGWYRILGRVDDVINVSGHRLGTAEIEDALNTSEFVAESAVIGKAHSIKGEAIVAFVVLNEGVNVVQIIEATLQHLLVKEIGAIAKAEEIVIVPGLPKTRSGKIMRRILRKISQGQASELGDISTLLNPEVVQEIIESYQPKA